MGDKIQVFENRLPTQEAVAALMRSADCGVFCSRAEGWGLESSEMMSLSKPVILTNYSGHTEYANSDNSLLIDIDYLEDSHDGVWFNATDPVWQGEPGQWASIGEPQMEQLICHMRSIHKQKQSGELKPNISGLQTAKPWTDCAKEIIQGLK
jgi:hypothetical protein